MAIILLNIFDTLYPDLRIYRLLAKSRYYRGCNSLFQNQHFIRFFVRYISLYVDFHCCLQFAKLLSDEFYTNWWAVLGTLTLIMGNYGYTHGLRLWNYQSCRAERKLFSLGGWKDTFSTRIYKVFSIIMKL
jgi:hypothetical protein